jgi:predicted nuclease of restriction endonuclease-like (RecB) superfamily
LNEYNKQFADEETKKKKNRICVHDLFHVQFVQSQRSKLLERELETNVESYETSALIHLGRSFVRIGNAESPVISSYSG